MLHPLGAIPVLVLPLVDMVLLRLDMVAQQQLQGKVSSRRPCKATASSQVATLSKDTLEGPRPQVGMHTHQQETHTRHQPETHTRHQPEAHTHHHLEAVTPHLVVPRHMEVGQAILLRQVVQEATPLVPQVAIPLLEALRVVIPYKEPLLVATRGANQAATLVDTLRATKAVDIHHKEAAVVL